MTEARLTDTLMREFLLGKLDDEERERIENLFLTDSEARERVRAAEQDLVEDYLENSLAPADRKRFLLLYGQTAEQQRQLRISKSIKDWALREAAASPTIVPTSSPWDRLRERLRLKPVFVIPIVVTAMIAIIVVAVLLNSRREQRNRRLAIEQQLAQLNSSSNLRAVPSHMISSKLSPIAVRGIEREVELKKSAETEIVELYLPWIQKQRYSAYQAEVHRVGENESFTISNLSAQDDSGYRIRMRLPAGFLHRGHYQIRLSGIGPNGNAELTEEYTFAVIE